VVIHRVMSEGMGKARKELSGHWKKERGSGIYPDAHHKGRGRKSRKGGGNFMPTNGLGSNPWNLNLGMRGKKLAVSRSVTWGS